MCGCLHPLALLPTPSLCEPILRHQPTLWGAGVKAALTQGPGLRSCSLPVSQPSVLRESSLSLTAGLPLLPCGGGAWDLRPTPQDTLTPFKDRLTPPILWCSIFFLALKDSSKRSINSDWKIELPGEFQIAGTTVRYVRRGLWEKISAKGPTKMPLHLMVSVVLLYLSWVGWVREVYQLTSSLGPCGRRYAWFLVVYLATCCSGLSLGLFLV